MVTTAPVSFTGKRYPTLKAGVHSLASIATENALTIKAVYDVRDFQDLVLRIINTHGSNSLDYYVEGSVLESPDDSSPASDWFTLSDTGGTSLTNIALANGVGVNRSIDVLRLAYVRIRTENTTTDQNASVSVDARASIRRIT